MGEPGAVDPQGSPGHAVRGTIDGVEIESAVVARSKRWFLLVDESVQRDAGIHAGDRVMVSLEPVATKKTVVTPRPRKSSGAAALQRLRAIVGRLPETSEKLAWGAPTFRVREKMFGMFLDDHHGDGRVALWCKAPPGAQESLVGAEPDHFFVPPYVGKGGWIGIHLDRGLGWPAIAALVEQAWRMTAPKRLLAGELERKSR